MKELTIAGLAKAGGVGVETVRYYQRRSLLREPPRGGGAGPGGGIRHYDATDIRRLRFIRAAQTAGFTLDEIGELLSLDATNGHARARDLATRRVAELDRRIAELKAARVALAGLARACAASDHGPCPIIASFEALAA